MNWAAQLLKDFPSDEYGGYWVKKTAEKHGVSTDTIRKRRALAEFLSKPKDLESVCDLMRQHDSPVGVSLFDKIRTVEDIPQRRKLLKRVIVEKLSRNDIDRILRNEYGSRREGGKRHKIKDSKAFINELRKTCITCSRLCEQGLGEDFFKELPESLQQQVKSVFQTNQATIARIEEYRKANK